MSYLNQNDVINQVQIGNVLLDDYVIKTSWFNNSNRLYVLSSSGKLYLSDCQGNILNQVSAHKGALTIDTNKITNITVTGGQDSKIKIWDNYKQIKEIDSVSQWVEHIVWSPDGKFLATVQGKSLIIYDDNFKPFKIYNNPESTIYGISWRSDSKEVSINSYGEVRIIPLQNSLPHKILKRKTSLISMAWSPNMKFIAAGTQDAHISFWQLPCKDDKSLYMSGYATKISLLDWSSNSRYLASDSDDQVVIWDVFGAGPANTRPIMLKPNKSKIISFKYQNKGDLFITGDNEGNFICWNPRYSEESLSEINFSEPISFLDWSPNDTKIAISTQSGSLKILDTKYFLALNGFIY